MPMTNDFDDERLRTTMAHAAGPGESMNPRPNRHPATRTGRRWSLGGLALASILAAGSPAGITISVNFRT